MSLERSGVRAAGRRFEHGCLNLEKSAGKIKIAGGLPEFRTADKHLAHLLIKQNIEVPLTQDKFLILEAEMLGRHRQKRFRKHAPFLHFECALSPLGFEHRPRCLNEIADVYGVRKEVEHFFVYIRLLQHQLHATSAVEKVGKHNAALSSQRHDTASQMDFLGTFFEVIKNSKRALVACIAM